VTFLLRRVLATTGPRACLEFEQSSFDHRDAAGQFAVT